MKNTFQTIALFFFLIVITAQTNAQIITTIAGTGTGGYSGDGGSALLAELNTPGGIAIDNSGNIFIAEYNNNIIRKIAATGVISTYAGTGTAGYSGDGGAATAAQLNGPSKIAFDKDGNLYIAEFGNNLVRKITSAGIISTFAGTGTLGYTGDGSAATAATFFNPCDVAIDKNGNVFIADYNNAVIRKVSTTGIITTVVGTGVGGYSGDGGSATAAKIYQGYGIALDTTGNLYIADAGNHRIRKVSGGIISTIAGTGIAGFSGDGSSATSAQLNNPAGIYVDVLNNIYIADQFNYRVRKISSSGIITTVAGNGINAFSGEGVIATTASLSNTNELTYDLANNMLYICDNSNNRIRIVTTCIAHIISQPKNDTVVLGSAAHFSISDTLGTGTYQWQENKGSGFSNLSNSVIYSGVTTKTLSISSTTAIMNSYTYRCVRSMITVCSDTSNAGKLIVKPLSISNININNDIHIYPNPATESIIIIAPIKIEKVDVIDLSGQLICTKNFDANKVALTINDLPLGIYFVKINNIYNQKLIKE